MTQQIKAVFVLISLYFNIHVLQAQINSPTLPSGNDNQTPFISPQSLPVVKTIYPLVVTEIITIDGRVIRGQLMDFSTIGNQSFYIISNRRFPDKQIPNDSIREIALVLPNREECNLYHHLGMLHMRNFSGGQNPNIGFIYGSGLEWGKKMVFTTNLFRQNEWDFNDSIRIIHSGFEVMIGYRINRSQKNIHALSGGLGMFSSRSPEQYNLAISMIAGYEFDIKVSRLTGVVFSSEVIYLPTRNHAFLSLGLKYRLYLAISPAEREYLRSNWYKL
jgi:hypothetical protein